MTILAALERVIELAKLATPGEWSTPHLSQDLVDCDCASILADGMFGSVATISVDNGLDIVDGGNDGSSLATAKVNGALIPAVVNFIRDHGPELLAALKNDARYRCLLASRDGMWDALIQVDGNGNVVADSTNEVIDAEIVASRGGEAGS